MYCVCCEVRTDCIYVMLKKVDRLCGLAVRVPGNRTEMYCVSCEVGRRKSGIENRDYGRRAPR
jgi:hypothetical protein